MSGHDEIEKARKAAHFRAESDRLEALGDWKEAAMQKFLAHCIEQDAYQDGVLQRENGEPISMEVPEK